MDKPKTPCTECGKICEEKTDAEIEACMEKRPATDSLELTLPTMAAVLR
jgi:hypothetical protein